MGVATSAASTTSLASAKTSPLLSSASATAPSSSQYSIAFFSSRANSSTDSREHIHHPRGRLLLRGRHLSIHALSSLFESPLPIDDWPESDMACAPPVQSFHSLVRPSFRLLHVLSAGTEEESSTTNEMYTGGRVQSFAVGADGRLSAAVSTVSSGGADSVHVLPLSSGGVAVANVRYSILPFLISSS